MESIDTQSMSHTETSNGGHPPEPCPPPEPLPPPEDDVVAPGLAIKYMQIFLS
jgi:hypothetical protein